MTTPTEPDVEALRCPSPRPRPVVLPRRHMTEHERLLVAYCGVTVVLTEGRWRP